MQTIGAGHNGIGLVHNLSAQARDFFESPLVEITHITVSQAVQSNMVDLARITSSFLAHAVARLINADC